MVFFFFWNEINNEKFRTEIISKLINSVDFITLTQVKFLMLGKKNLLNILNY